MQEAGEQEAALYDRLSACLRGESTAMSISVLTALLGNIVAYCWEDWDRAEDAAGLIGRNLRSVVGRQWREARRLSRARRAGGGDGV
jgi:hypothetical protein